MDMTAKQRKFLLVCGVIVVVSYAARFVVTTAQQMAFHQQQVIQATQRQQAKAQADAKAKTGAQAQVQAPVHAPSSPTIAPALPAPQASSGAPAGTVLPPSPFARLSGIWRGSAAIEGRGICGLKFELRQASADAFLGYSTFTCGTVAPLMSAKDRANPKSALMSQMNPDAAILTGAPKDGVIQFHVDKTFGRDINGCAVTSFTLTPFGANQLAAEWKAGECQGGHMMLRRMPQ